MKLQKRFVYWLNIGAHDERLTCITRTINKPDKKQGGKYT